MTAEIINPDQEYEALKAAVARMVRVPPVKQRTTEKILSEYDRSKYGGILDRNPADWSQVLASESVIGNRDPQQAEFITRGDRFYIGTAAEHEQQTYSLVMSALREHPSPRYCELGCGFGRFVHLGREEFPESKFYGGELSGNAVTVAQRFQLDVTQFDFTSVESYQLIQPDTTVFTVQAIEQLASAQCVLDGLRSVRDRVTRVIHFEPGPYLGRSGVLGHLRQAYTIWNAYNRDLLALLHHAPDIRIVDEQHDVIGVNPLNPIHQIVWEFC